MKTKVEEAPGGGRKRAEGGREGGRTGGRWMEVGQQERCVEEMGGCEGKKRQPPLGCVLTSHSAIVFQDVDVAVQAG